MKQRNCIQDVQAVFIGIHKQFLGPDLMARQVAEAGRKLPISQYDCEKKEWDLDKDETAHNYREPCR